MPLKAGRDGQSVVELVHLQQTQRVLFDRRGARCLQWHVREPMAIPRGFGRTLLIRLDVVLARFECNEVRTASLLLEVARLWAIYRDEPGTGLWSRSFKRVQSLSRGRQSEDTFVAIGNMYALAIGMIALWYWNFIDSYQTLGGCRSFESPAFLGN